MPNSQALRPPPSPRRGETAKAGANYGHRGRQELQGKHSWGLESFLSVLGSAAECPKPYECKTQKAKPYPIGDPVG